MAKAKKPLDEKLDNIDFDLFAALAAIDRKDYDYYDTLTDEQQKRFVPYMMLFWTSAVKGKSDVQNYYLQSTEYHANKYMFNEVISRHPKLQWMMLCASSPNIGKQFHQYISHIKTGITKLTEKASAKEIKDYFKKLYPQADVDTLDEITNLFVLQQHRKVYLAEKFAHLKYDDIELLNELATDEEIAEYEKHLGN